MRNFRREYDEYQGQPKQIKNRALRNAARRKMVKRYGKSRLRGRDVDHRKGVDAGNGASNLRVVSEHFNRSFPRTKSASVLRRRP